ncbi:hypothetical protein LOTGIDRAFT_209595 [Lottia gigantea]|uniref:SH3 domain-containing protein n=1 Tax=Lottia gigantea TaxID=225164 RepID=V4A3D5_LOTGI|nr:hypothetical protein LOTGIDRAFT_209595 [Lottia gigantea]ESO91242.1 hypothetical protein LOTGIDRAFT_209595 [Lottia gigantea]
MDRRRSRYPNDRDAIYGNFAYRYRSPPVRDFTDIFQKMKLSINLLAKLKPYINAPNSPELVHFLFTPLSLVFDASRDPTIRHLNLSESAIVPMLTAAAKDLLLNCLTSKEIELWKLLGRNWTMTVDEWKGLLPFYTPKFYDGWEPSPSLYPSVEASQPSPTTVTSNIEVHSNLENSTGIMHIPVVIEEKPSLPTILDNTSATGNTRELKLKKGDIVGLIDNTKNWWKVRNQEGVIGFAPYTILSTLKENDDRIAFKF